MPRTTNSNNQSYYHYIVHKLDDEGNHISSKYHKTQKEITNEYNLNRSAIYYNLNPVMDRIPRIKYNVKIEKIMIPVFQKQYVNPEIEMQPNQQII
tara:strand:- start:2348 stop:2635 length:288 start_codon:yes stop_codon:yes gene_type:complete